MAAPFEVVARIFCPRPAVVAGHLRFELSYLDAELMNHGTDALTAKFRVLAPSATQAGDYLGERVAINPDIERVEILDVIDLRTRGAQAPRITTS